MSDQEELEDLRADVGRTKARVSLLREKAEEADRQVDDVRNAQASLRNSVMVVLEDLDRFDARLAGIAERLRAAEAAGRPA